MQGLSIYAQRFLSCYSQSPGSMLSLLVMDRRVPLVELDAALFTKSGNELYFGPENDRWLWVAGESSRKSRWSELFRKERNGARSLYAHWLSVADSAGQHLIEMQESTSISLMEHFRSGVHIWCQVLVEAVRRGDRVQGLGPCPTESAEVLEEILAELAGQSPKESKCTHFIFRNIIEASVDLCLLLKGREEYKGDRAVDQSARCSGAPVPSAEDSEKLGFLDPARRLMEWNGERYEALTDTMIDALELLLKRYPEKVVPEEMEHRVGELKNGIKKVFWMNRDGKGSYHDVHKIIGGRKPYGWYLKKSIDEKLDGSR
jgi:hypothetical protein